MDGDYFDRANPDLLALIPPDAKAVLEVGCGAGKLAELHRRVNPRVEWHGFEPDIKASVKAAYRGVYVTPNRVEDCEFGDEAFADCLILGDVLEHMEDPWGQLKRLTTLVKPGGQVLASIPNVQHWTMIASLLRGEWDYQDEGLMDRTHLRWFTLKSIKAMFKQAGLGIFEIRGRQLCNDGWDQFRYSANVFRDAIGDWDAFVNQTRAYQYVVRAEKPASGTMFGWPITNVGVTLPQPDRLHIHAVGAEECCARPRIHEPFAALATIPGVRIVAPNGKPDIVVMQRDRFARILISTYASMAAEGSILVAELDDHPGPIGMLADDALALRAVHAVQVSTEALADVVRQYNPEVAVFPNQIADLPPPRTEHREWPIRIFFGAQNRQDDWRPIMPALNRVLLSHGEDVEIMVVHDRDFYDAIDDKLVKDFVSFKPYGVYREILRSCDIALLPLEDTEFNRMKSDLKFLECASEGVACLASPTVYKDVARVSIGGKLILRETMAIARNPDQWESMLESLIKNSEFRRNLVMNAYTYVRDHRMLGMHYRKRLDWYRSLITRREELARALAGRVPELASR